MSPNDMQAVFVYLDQQGYLVLTPDQCRSLLQEAHERGKASNTSIRTFSQDHQATSPPRKFMQAFLPEHFDEAFSLYFNDQHFPEGLPRYAPKFFGMEEDEFAGKSKLELFEVVSEAGDKITLRWLDPQKIVGLPEEIDDETKSFAAGSGTRDRSKLRRVQITNKNGVRTWVWVNPEKEQVKQKEPATSTSTSTPERTTHPENTAKPSADYHPTAIAEQAVANAFQNPAAMNPSHIEHIAEHLDVLQVGKLKQMAKEVRLRIGGRKAALVDRLIQHLQYLHGQGQGQGQGQQPPQAAAQGQQEPQEPITPTATPGPAAQAQPAPTPPPPPVPPSAQPPPDPALDMGNLDSDASIRGTASTPRGRNPDEAKDRNNVTQGEHARAAKEWQAKNGPPPGSTLTPRQRWQALAKRRGELAEQEKTARQRGSVVRKIPSLQPLANAYKNASPQLKEITDSLMYNLSGVASADKIARQLTTAWNDGERLGLKPEESSIIDNAMSQSGLSKQGEPGETARFNGAYMEGPAGLFTGDQVKILRPAVIMRRADGGEYVVQRGQVEKAEKVDKADKADKADAKQPEPSPLPLPSPSPSQSSPQSGNSPSTSVDRPTGGSNNNPAEPGNALPGGKQGDAKVETTSTQEHPSIEIARDRLNSRGGSGESVGQANPKIPDAGRPHLKKDEIAEVQDCLEEGTAYHEINEELRQGGRLGYGAKTLQNAIMKAPKFSSPVKASRGIQVSREDLPALIEELKSGEFTHAGFVSASTQSSFPGNVQFDIIAHQGLDASFYGANAGEILLPAGTSFKVKNLEQKGNSIKATLEQVVEG
jgi:hypothetical protein